MGKYLWHAFSHPANLIFLGASLMAALVFRMPAVLGGFLVVETIALLSAAGNKKFRLMTDGKLAREEDRLNMTRMRYHLKASRELGGRMNDFEKKVRQIGLNYRQKARGVSDNLLDESLEALTRLEEQYIRHAHALAGLLSLKNDATLPQLEDKKKQIEAQLGSASPAVREALEKQLEIIGKRIANRTVSTDSREIIEAQLATMEETLHYLLDESVKVFDAGSVNNHVDQVLVRMETTAETIREIETFVSMTENPLGNSSVAVR